MNTRNGTLAVLAALSCAAGAAAPAVAAPTDVTVRVEGATKTIFEGKVTSDGHSLTKDSTGAHPCDGTNGGVNPAPGATLTAALDDATKLAGLEWGGSWDDSFQDFLVTKIGPDEADSSNFWGYALNGVPTSVGGCQQQIEHGDEVLFYFGGTFDNILRASAPKQVRAGRRFHVRVRTYVTAFDEQGRASTEVKPIAGARIGGKKTNGSGLVTLRYAKPGTKRLKATRAKAVRSNQIAVKILRRR